MFFVAFRPAHCDTCAHGSPGRPERPTESLSQRGGAGAHPGPNLEFVEGLGNAISASHLVCGQLAKSTRKSRVFKPSRTRGRRSAPGTVRMSNIGHLHALSGQKAGLNHATNDLVWSGLTRHRS